MVSRSPRRAIVAVAALAAACHHAHPAAPAPKLEVSAAYAPTALAYPAGAASDFTVCQGLALVCVQGGVAAAGLDGWVVDPKANGLTSVACAGAGDGWALRGAELVRLPVDKAAPWTVVAKLPAGRYQLVDTGAAEPIVWGQVDATHHWIVARVRGDQGVVLYEDAEPIGAVTMAARGTLLVAVAHRLLRVTATGATPKLVLDASPDGLAIGADGALFASLPAGLVRVTKDGVKPVAAGVHGPLRIENDALYVLLRDRNVVLRLLRR